MRNRNKDAWKRMLYQSRVNAWEEKCKAYPDTIQQAAQAGREIYADNSNAPTPLRLLKRRHKPGIGACIAQGYINVVGVSLNRLEPASENRAENNEKHQHMVALLGEKIVKALRDQSDFCFKQTGGFFSKPFSMPRRDCFEMHDMANDIEEFVKGIKNNH